MMVVAITDTCRKVEQLCNTLFKAIKWRIIVGNVLDSNSVKRLSNEEAEDVILKKSVETYLKVHYQHKSLERLGKTMQDLMTPVSRIAESRTVVPTEYIVGRCFCTSLVGVRSYQVLNSS
jgi:hypothetical protein